MEPKTRGAKAVSTRKAHRNPRKGVCPRRSTLWWGSAHGAVEAVWRCCQHRPPPLTRRRQGLPLLVGAPHRVTFSVLDLERLVVFAGDCSGLLSGGFCGGVRRLESAGGDSFCCSWTAVNLRSGRTTAACGSISSSGADAFWRAASQLPRPNPIATPRAIRAEVRPSQLR